MSTSNPICRKIAISAIFSQIGKSAKEKSYKKHFFCVFCVFFLRALAYVRKKQYLCIEFEDWGRNRPPRYLKDWHTRKQLGTLGGCTSPARVLGAFLPSCVALSARGGFVCRSCIPCASCEGSPSPTFKNCTFGAWVCYIFTRKQKSRPPKRAAQIY